MADYHARRIAMVDTQVRPSDVTKFPIIDAMLSVPKEDFVGNGQREAAYLGENLELAGGRTILEPRTMAKMLDALNISSDQTVLDLGCGYGYSSAVLARMADVVVAVEEDDAMAEEAQSRLSEAGVDNVAVMAGRLAEGDAKHGPYDAIILQGGAEQVPDSLLDQLREGGRIAVIFMDGALGTVKIGHKSASGVNWRYAFNAAAPVVTGFEKKAAFAL